MLNDFLTKLKCHIFIEYMFLLSALFFADISIADNKSLHSLSMGIGGYSTSYNGGFQYTIEGVSGVIPLPKETNFGLNIEYSRVISAAFTLDSSFHYSSSAKTIKSSTCRDSSSRILISCKISLESTFYSISLLGTYRYPIGSSAKVYLGSGISANLFNQGMSYEAKGYEKKSIDSTSSSPKVNLALKLGVSFKKLNIEYIYLGDTNKAETSALGVSSISVGYIF